MHVPASARRCVIFIGEVDTPNGWFYGARLPSGARLVAYHTDSDLASKGSWRREFADLVAGTVIARAFHMDEALRSSPPLPARVAAVQRKRRPT
jgi:hypothetical protein